jgi:FkbM family methyltransferase
MPSLESTKLVTHKLKYAGQKLSVTNFAADKLINYALRDHRVWEPWQLSLMQRIIKPHFTCVDIGANIGINAMFMARCCPDGRVFAYEPFDAIYGLLCRNIEQNRLANVTAINKGISDAAGALAMVTDPELVGGAHVSEPGAAVGEGHVGGLFRFARLDEEMRERGVDRIDFMKIDVEGHELKALASAIHFLRSPGLQLAIEFNPGELRRPAPPGAAFPDCQLFSILQSCFRHIFFICRDNTLLELGNFHALRRRLLGWYFVDDLYCTNHIPPEIADLIANSPTVSHHVRCKAEVRGGMLLSYANREADGWTLTEPLRGGPTTSIYIRHAGGRHLALNFDPIDRKKLHSGEYTSWPVWVMINDLSFTVDLLETRRVVYLDPGPRPVDVTIQSEHGTPVSGYHVNPRQVRLAGIRVEVIDQALPANAAAAGVVSALSGNVRTTQEDHAGMLLSYANRDLDGWILSETPDGNPSMSLGVRHGAGRRLLLKLGRMHARHLHSPDYKAWPVWVTIDGCAIMFDLLDTPAEMYLDPGSGPLDITIRSEHATPASSYLGNPQDPRFIGFRVEVVDPMSRASK